MNASRASRVLRSRHGTHLGALLLYAIAMGWLEGVVVVYIRGLIGIPHTQVFPSPEEVMRRLGELPWLIPTEQTREAATLLMLAVVAWMAAKSRSARFGALLIIFGVWDITYYITLYALLRWPPSLATMDLLFLLPPHPWWYQPVWVPIAISIVMVGIGLRLYRFPRVRRI